jgi:transcriptional regulator with XRE-family HTH domain
MQSRTITKLRALRGSRGKPNKRLKTLRELSESTGFSLGHLSDVEQGRKEAGPEMIEALAAAHRVARTKMAQICAATFRAGQHDVG